MDHPWIAETVVLVRKQLNFFAEEIETLIHSPTSNC
jgi:hypothetical protein